MKYEIKKIDILGAGVFSGIFCALLGLVPLVFGIVAMLANAFTQGFEVEFLGFLLFPVGFFVAGFVVGLIFGSIYNKVAEQWGGIRMEIDYNEDK